MKIDLIANTCLTNASWRVFNDMGFVHDDGSREAEDLIEFAGRLCYESYNKPNEATRANKDYLANVALQKHFSVFEHASVTFLFRGVSRALTHELVRHRHFSFSQVSQRYVDSSRREFVKHPVLDDSNFQTAIREHADASSELYETLVENLVQKGYSRKEARGAARLVLPEGTTTDIVVTGNFRSWLEFIDKRATKFADAEIRQLASEVLRLLQHEFPNAFQDSIASPEETRPEPVSLASAVSVRKEDVEEVPLDVLALVQNEIKKALNEVFNR